jgi:GT2 family glycosyltransferase
MGSVDVVIPCFKYAHYLEACVASVLSQRGVDLRILILDDASPDNTPEVATRLAAADARITYQRNPVNLGLIATANRGVINWARATYTLLLSADDYLLPYALTRAVYVLDRHPDVHLVFGQAQIVTDDTRPVTGEAGMTPDYQIISGRDYLRRACEVGTPAPSPSTLVRTAAQQRLGGYLKQFSHTSDMEMWMRFAAQGPIGVIRQSLAGYRWHGANMTLAYTNRAVSDRRERIATAQYVFDSCNGPGIEGFSRWLDDMKQRVAREALFNAGRAIEAGDVETTNACLALAEECAPELLRSAGWKLKARQLVGPAIASSLRNGLDRLRRKPGERPWFQHDSELGWWPDPAQAIQREISASPAGRAEAMSNT